MKLYAVITPSHRPLYERFFLPSLDTDAFELIPCLLQQDGAGEFLADDFKNCIRFKLAKILESIEQNSGAIVVWSDIDIQFFRLRPAHILAYFDRTTDFVAQRWSLTSNEVCGGFYAIRCAPAMYEFFTEVSALTRDRTGGNEQDAINLALKTSSSHINWRFFGPEFYSRSHGIRIPPDALLHHATCVVPSDYINQKIALLTQLENFGRWDSMKKRLYILRQVPGALKRKFAVERPL
jgi:Nucleotide-diphospho-sugar transferase